MSTWHQDQATKRLGIKLYHDKQWTVVIDPPNRMRALKLFTTRELADVYMRGLQANSPGDAQYSYILPPGGARV